MIAVISHLAASPERTACGMTIPSTQPSVLTPVKGSRVGIVTGVITWSAYVITKPGDDSNELCPRCFAKAQ